VTTGLLFDVMNPEPSRHRWVPDTSKAAHREAVAEGRISARGEEVLTWLHDMTHREDGLHPVTSAELAGPEADLRLILHVRRGLSDLRKAGIVCKGEDRRCEVSGRVCNTWKVVTR
jgi:hypothetical protein